MPEHLSFDTVLHVFFGGLFGFKLGAVQQVLTAVQQVLT